MLPTHTKTQTMRFVSGGNCAYSAWSGGERINEVSKESLSSTYRSFAAYMICATSSWSSCDMVYAVPKLWIVCWLSSVLMGCKEQLNSGRSCHNRGGPALLTQSCGWSGSWCDVQRLNRPEKTAQMPQSWAQTVAEKPLWEKSWCAFEREHWLKGTFDEEQTVPAVPWKEELTCSIKANRRQRSIRYHHHGHRFLMNCLC